MQKCIKNARSRGLRVKNEIIDLQKKRKSIIWNTRGQSLHTLLKETLLRLMNTALRCYIHK